MERGRRKDARCYGDNSREQKTLSGSLKSMCVFFFQRQHTRKKQVFPSESQRAFNSSGGWNGTPPPHRSIQVSTINSKQTTKWPSSYPLASLHSAEKNRKKEELLVSQHNSFICNLMSKTVMLTYRYLIIDARPERKAPLFLGLTTKKNIISEPRSTSTSPLRPKSVECFKTKREWQSRDVNECILESQKDLNHTD